MLAPSPQATWPITGDVADLLTIVQDQAETITAQEALLHAYQSNLNAAQAPAPTTATGSSNATTTLTLSNVVGAVLLGSTITGTGVPTSPPVTIVAQLTGNPGAAGTYTTSVVTTLTSVALSFSPGGGASAWPVPQDAITLMLIVQQQTAVLRVQTALLQHYQDLLTTSQTPPPPTGP
jgi:hypothetical protein